MKRLKAFTLVEMLMTMTMGSSLMVLAIGLVHQSMSMSKLAKVRSEHDRSIARLAQKFRSDVHSATEVISLTPEMVSLKLTDESTVTYKQDAATVIWERNGPGTENAREFFRFDERSAASFEIQSNPSRVVLQVERRLESTEVLSPIDLRIVAVVGRWQQLEKAEGNNP